jgi:hypothetical protein
MKNSNIIKLTFITLGVSLALRQIAVYVEGSNHSSIRLIDGLIGLEFGVYSIMFFGLFLSSSKAKS